MAFQHEQLPSRFAKFWITELFLLWSVLVVVAAWEPLVRSYVPPADRACHPLTDGAGRCGLSITAYKLASSSPRLSNRNPWCSTFLTLAGKYHYLFVAGEPGTTASNLYPFNPSSSIAAGAPTVGWPVTLPLQHILAPIQACQAFNVEGIGFSLAGSVPAGGNERGSGGGASVITAQVNNTVINNNNTPGEWHKQLPPSSLPLSLSPGAAAPAITPSEIPVNMPSSGGGSSSATPSSSPAGDSAVLVLAAPGSFAHAVRVSFDVNSHSLFVATPQRLPELHLNDFSILRTGRFGTLVAFSRHLGTNECSTPYCRLAPLYIWDVSIDRLRLLTYAPVRDSESVSCMEDLQAKYSTNSHANGGDRRSGTSPTAGTRLDFDDSVSTDSAVYCAYAERIEPSGLSRIIVFRVVFLQDQASNTRRAIVELITKDGGGGSNAFPLLAMPPISTASTPPGAGAIPPALCGVERINFVRGHNGRLFLDVSIAREIVTPLSYTVPSSSSSTGVTTATTNYFSPSMCNSSLSTAFMCVWDGRSETFTSCGCGRDIDLVIANRPFHVPNCPCTYYAEMRCCEPLYITAGEPCIPTSTTKCDQGEFLQTFGIPRSIDQGLLPPNVKQVDAFTAGARTYLSLATPYPGDWMLYGLECAPSISKPTL